MVPRYIKESAEKAATFTAVVLDAAQKELAADVLPSAADRGCDE